MGRRALCWAKLLAIGMLCVLCAPAPAYAYLDPGTGNILIYATVSILGALAFVLKGIGYKLLGLFGRKPRPAASGGHEELVLFSEGKAYWNTFKPVVEALIRKNRPFRYLTMDIADPGLMIEHPCMRSRYIGSGSSAFAKVCAARCRVMLATTPNIGIPGYPMPKPKHADCLVHVFHGPGGLDTYKKHSLDCYTAVLLTHERFGEGIRALEALRGLPEKELVPAGLPYLDALAAKAGEHARAEEGGRGARNAQKTVLVAPSWGAKGSLALCAATILPQLLAAGHAVILRPHPQSRAHEPELLAAVIDAFPSVSLDFEADGTASMRRADILISDMSGIRFDFALLHGKPVITLRVPGADFSGYEAADLGSMWEDEVSPLLGPVVDTSRPVAMDAVLAEALAMPADSLAALRDRFVCNFGASGDAIAAWCAAKCGAVCAGPSRSPAAQAAAAVTTHTLQGPETAAKPA